METTTKSRLHPLLTAAAISLTVFSAVGVAALTGVLPTSRGSSEPVIAAEAQKPIEHVVTMPAPAPAAKPKPRPVARHTAPLPPVAQAPAVEPVKPAPLPGAGGVVESVKEVRQDGESTAIGPVAGGVIGAIAGHQIGGGRTRTVATAVGAGAGILAGKAIEKTARATKHWDVTVRLDDGSSKTISSDSEPAWHAGERVRLVEGRILKSQG